MSERAWSLSRLVAVAVFASGIAAGFLAHPQSTEFAFACPEGWEAIRAEPPPRSEPFAHWSVAQTRGLPFASMNVGIDHRHHFHITERFAARWRQNRERDGGAADAGSETMAVASAEVVQIQGVPALRAVRESPPGPHAFKQLEYVFSGEEGMATVTYGCAPEDYAGFLPTFEESARATQGLKPFPLWGRLIFALTLVGPLLFFLLDYRRRRARRRGAAP
jgi:hypothetical protein